MDTKKAILKLCKLEKQEDELNLKIEQIEHQENEIEKELSLYWGEKAYGLKIGDVIEFTKTTWHKTEIVRMRVERFGVIIYNFGGGERDFDKVNSKPSIHGTRVKKDGSLGNSTVGWYDHDKECSEFKKIEQ